MQVFDGAAERLPCNGVGRCDKQTGICRCVAGFSGDQDSGEALCPERTWWTHGTAQSQVRSLCSSGPCGRAAQPTFSDHTVQQQCPSATTADGTLKPLDYKRTPIGYLSVNANESMPDSIWTQRELYPVNGSHIFKVTKQTTFLSCCCFLFFAIALWGFFC